MTPARGRARTARAKSSARAGPQARLVTSRGGTGARGGRYGTNGSSYIDHKNEEAWGRESMCSSFSGSYTQSEVDAMEASEDRAEARRSRALSPQRDPFIFVLAVVVSWS